MQVLIDGPLHRPPPLRQAADTKSKAWLKAPAGRFHRLKSQDRWTTNERSPPRAEECHRWIRQTAGGSARKNSDPLPQPLSEVHWETATVKVTIAPGTKAEIAASDALSRAGSAKELADEARANNTPVVLVTVGILKATYRDRSAWRDREALKRNIFDDGRAEKKEACPSSMRPRWTPAPAAGPS